MFHRSLSDRTHPQCTVLVQVDAHKKQTDPQIQHIKIGASQQKDGPGTSSGVVPGVLGTGGGDGSVGCGLSWGLAAGFPRGKRRKNWAVNYGGFRGESETWDTFAGDSRLLAAKPSVRNEKKKARSNYGEGSRLAAPRNARIITLGQATSHGCTIVMVAPLRCIQWHG